MTLKHVVVEDPTHEYWDGGLVTDRDAAVIASRGGTCLPVEPEVVRTGGVNGWYKRSYGAGWPLETKFPTLACRMVLGMRPGNWRVHCAYRLLPGPEVLELVAQPALLAARFPGTLGLVGDTGQPGIHSPRVKPDRDVLTTSMLGPMDRNKGWTIQAPAAATTERDGAHGFALYGSMPGGFRVAWVALSVTSVGK